MSIYIAYLVIFLLGATPFFEVVGVIPIGVAAGLEAVPVTILAFAGNMVTIYLLILLTDKVKAWLHRRKEKKIQNGEHVSEKKEIRAGRVWKKYGLPGLSLVAPFITGSHLGAILAMGFGGSKIQITVWMTISVVVWTLVMGFASYYGMGFLTKSTGSTGFLADLLK
jgi:Ca2+/H+ antiporter, TMEM165/GDT1 family